MTAKKKTEKKAELATVGMNLGQMEQLLSFMREHGLEEFEYSQGDLHIRLKRAPAHSNSAAPGVGMPVPGVAVPTTAASPAPSAAPPAPVAAAPAPTAETPPPAPAAEAEHIVKSPIVGTFYASPSPDAPIFVKVGDTVSVGQVLCIIEAMKLMNEIESDIAGEILRVVAENGQPVEYGEPLFAIRPSAKK